MNPTLLSISLAAGFLLGSIPFALLIGLAKGIDIRAVGSKNPGATNLGRQLGFKWFLLCFMLDAAKGLAPTLTYAVLSGAAGDPALPASHAFAWLGVMISPVLGHMYSPWIGFRGGKGVATGLGALLGVYPVLTIPGLGAFFVFITTLGIWRYVGLSSVLAAGSLPLWVWYFGELLRRGASAGNNQPPVIWPYLGIALLLAVLVIFKHRGNLSRLAAGVEPKIGAPKTPEPTTGETPPAQATADQQSDTDNP